MSVETAFPPIIRAVVCAAAALLYPEAASAAVKGPIVLEGGDRHPGHVQGVCTDGEHIYWSMTYDLIKTDLAGKEIARFAAKGTHIGDICWRKGKVYAGINCRTVKGCRKGDEVWVFDTKDMSRERVFPTPQTVWCNNGIEWFRDRFWVIGSTPTHSRYNFVFEYTEDFRFVQCRPIESGWSNLGVQTICLKDDVMYFGCYGAPKDPQFPHKGGVFAVAGDMLTKRSRSVEIPYVAPILGRFDGAAAEGMLVLDGDMWVALGTCTRQPSDSADPNARPKRLFGARLVRKPDFGKNL